MLPRAAGSHIPITSKAKEGEDTEAQRRDGGLTMSQTQGQLYVSYLHM